MQILFRFETRVKSLDIYGTVFGGICNLIQQSIIATRTLNYYNRYLNLTMITKRIVSILLLIGVFLVSISSTAHAIDTSRPGPENVPTNVEVRLFVLDIDEINDAEQSFTANIFIETKWKDHRLVTSNENTAYDLEDVWNPNLQFVNRQKIFKSMPEIVQVDQDGTVVYKQRVVGKFSQPLNLHDFPLDKQTLEFQIVSTGNSSDEVNLIEKFSGISEKLSIPDWQIKGIDLKKMEYSFMPSEPPLEGMLLSINAKRYIQFYIYKFIVPLLLIVFMSWIVFWIDPTDYTTQISISITSMLTLIAYQYLAVSSLPEVPYLTRLDALMFFSTVLVFASLVEVTITSVLTKKNKVELARSIDYYCRFIFPTIFVLIFITRIATL